jgi:hypothetical protein
VHSLRGFFEAAEKKRAEKFDASSKLTGLLPRVELVKCLEQMALLGRAFSLPHGPALSGGCDRTHDEAEAESPHHTSFTSKPALSDAAGLRSMYERVFKAIDMAEAAKGTASADNGAGAGQAGGSKGGKGGPAAVAALAAGGGSSGGGGLLEGTSWRLFMAAVVHGVRDDETRVELLPPLRWAALPPHAVADKAAELFSEASSLQRRVLTSSHESADDVKAIGELSTYATRLHKLVLQHAHDHPQVLSPAAAAARSAAEALARAAADEAAAAAAEAAAEAGGRIEDSTAINVGAVNALVAVGRFKAMGGAADAREKAASEKPSGSGGALATAGVALAVGGKLPPLGPVPAKPPSPAAQRARKLDQLRRKFRLSIAESEAMLGPTL